MTLSWREKWKVAVCGLMIKTGRLTYDDYTTQELQALLTPLFPRSFPFDVPGGKARLTITEAQVHCQEESNRLALQCFAELNITVLDTPLYRAHVIVVISGTPVYDIQNHVISIEDLKSDAIQLVNDNYALLNDTRSLIRQIVPGLQLGKSLTEFISAPLLNIASIATTGKTDRLLSYLRLYLDHNKQRILDYHKPEIDAVLQRHAETQDLSYALGGHWREDVFQRWGKQVFVVNGGLRFSFR